MRHWLLFSLLLSVSALAEDRNFSATVNEFTLKDGTQVQAMYYIAKTRGSQTTYTVTGLDGQTREIDGAQVASQAQKNVTVRLSEEKFKALMDQYKRVEDAAAADAQRKAEAEAAAKHAEEHPAEPLYDSGDPTPDEQFVLEMVNRARANPTAEGMRLGIDINEGLAPGLKAVPRPPLAMNKTLLAVARSVCKDLSDRAYFDHVNPDGKTPFQRIKDAGYDYRVSGENIAGNGTPDDMEDRLMIDANIALRGHRVNLLNIGEGDVFQEVGIAYYVAPTRNAMKLKEFMAQEFGASGKGAFLLGVVYKDSNGNRAYDVGEGLSGVTIKMNGAPHYAITKQAGGYAIPIKKADTYTVTASGGPLSQPQTESITIQAENIKRDFVLKP